MQVEVVLNVAGSEVRNALLQIQIDLVTHLWLFALASSTFLAGCASYLH